MKVLLMLCLVFAYMSLAHASGDPPPVPTWDAPTPPARAAPPEARTTPISKPAQKKRRR